MAKTNTSVNGKDYFRIQRVVDGKKKSFYGSSERDAKRKYDKYLEAQIRKGYEKAVRADMSLFSERAEEFIDNALKPSQKYAHGTIERYVSAYNTHIKYSSLSDMVAKDVRASDIQAYYNEIDVSMQTLRQIHKFMSAFYKWMVRNEYASDALYAVEIPRKKDNSRHEEIIVWSDAELDAIIDGLDNYRYRFFIYTLIYTGMRFSEVLGLKYSDIKNNTIHIKRQVYMGEIKDPKANSFREIPMHEVLIEEYKRHKEWHRKEMKENGYKTDFIFTTNTGNLIHRSSLDKSIRRYYKRIGITPKHIHAYRSTFCTHLCTSGVPIEVASKLLGHKSILVTAKHYAQVQPQSKREAIDSLDFSFKK